ncbi:hypothetical protein PsYK624_170410 [Phanerochaete sordida]|uniref:Uncharacterized protein n=1 Tax=Phanerochaete sordida TaxID=48140 RepID=A0A9P3GYN5_9APHY|nr:hypothetical protein PsYK624_170410 [Phanerochaete sordida]
MIDPIGLEVDFVVGSAPRKDTRFLRQIIIADYGSLVRREEPDWALIESILARHCPQTSLDIVYSGDTSPETFERLSHRISAEMQSQRVSMHHRMEDKGPIIDFIDRLKGIRRRDAS